MSNFFFDMLLVVVGWGAAQLIFAAYEAHVSWPKRLGKLIVMLLLLGSVQQLGGRWLFYAVLGLLSAGIAFLHGYWFHIRHGIHWRKAEPRDAYLRLIGKE